ncbi:probable RNA-dependent RNA polymerase 5 isoform X2 [Punica granatum]|uniref:RNA-dependent RNA polymerase n=1 Tax=Punica granatum TaxID=22663 RepID=A0A218VZQ8_PUNGR|nr:probable RNA-dependent RNA polymerase 5 isoform X2 [Punica granatum]OWM66067.1 hypothetical protein CDL15_Pgr015494 [Punica granatum]
MNDPNNNGNVGSTQPQPQRVPLPNSVEDALRRICTEQSQPQPEAPARRELADMGEVAALQVLEKISGTRIKRSLDGFIVYMGKRARSTGGSSSPSPHKSSSERSGGGCPATKQALRFNVQSSLDGFIIRSTGGPPSPSPHKSSSERNCGGSPAVKQVLNFNDDASVSSPIRMHLGENSLLGSENGSGERTNPSEALNELEFLKAFLLLSYIGEAKLEEVISTDEIRQLKDLQMADFESKIWDRLGSRLVKGEDRCKGPFINKTRTLLHKTLGDENVLLVKLEGFSSVGHPDSLAVYREIAKDGILVGSRRYRFFVFKDGKGERKKDRTASSVKCYFVHLEGNPIFANKSVHEARCMFMHAHTVSSVSNYMIRFSLILSKTVSLEVDLAGVKVEVIPDVECKDEKGNTIYDRKGKPLIHTDGTGYVSADIASKCPGSIIKGKCISNQVTETLAGSGEKTSEQMQRLESHFDEAPLLIQCRLFHEGRAVKGTLLVNNLLNEKTIQVRDSMIKVEKDPQLSTKQTVNSLEIVGMSNKPKGASLSKTLIALLSYGGVPNDYFLNLLKNALGDARGVFSSKRSALKVSLNHCEMDNFNSARMILGGIPLEEPYLHFHLSILMKLEKKSLRSGRIPIPDSYYLMGTADPTGSLKPDEVCIILDSGQISGEVLVYRNPGLHFGDIHVLKATYREELEAYVGNSKYGILFPSVGPRSLADEIAGGDFDGDMYWVSRNPQLLKYYKLSKPWTSASIQQVVNSTKPSDLTADQLEEELINLWLTARFRPSYAISEAADSWQALMDRFLTISADQPQERDLMERNMLQLIDLYYDALDQPKKGGKKVEVPPELKADVFPHYMGKNDSYTSSSILGIIYDTVNSFLEEDHTVREVWKLPIFDVGVSEACLKKWTDLYDNYRKDMAAALNRDEGEDESADEVIQKYKQIFLEAAEFEESSRREEDIFEEALAIYNITYDYAKNVGSVGLCAFAWRVAGSALCKFHAMKQGEKSITCLPSILKEILS